MLNQQYVMPEGLTPYAGVTAKSPWLASETEKRQRKICDSLETAIRRSGLQNGMTISFHHAFRGGDKVVNMVMATLAEMGFRDLTLASSSLIDAHWPLIEHIKNGVIRQIYTSGLRGKLGEEISAGLSISIVKNAIYKVIRAASADDLGKHIVVQGGTFLNDAVLRAFEQELGRDVTRPTISGIMGAFGAALAARDLHLEKSSVLTAQALEKFTHTAKPATCGLCTNHCALTVNTFDGGRRFVSGNRCSRPLGEEPTHLPDLMRYKYAKLRALQGKGQGDGSRGRIGIPFGLNMYENLPFWFELFTRLNFEVVLSPESSRKLYVKGQRTIPSDTVCYPAKLLHGHMEALVEQGVDAIFYPCMPYNFNEGVSDNNYNCPVVAYYPELLAANVPELKKTRYLYPYFGLHRPRDFERKAGE